MNVHKNARLTPRGRVLMVEQIESGVPVKQAAAALGMSERRAHVWLRPGIAAATGNCWTAVRRRIG